MGEHINRRQGFKKRKSFHENDQSLRADRVSFKHYLKQIEEELLEEELLQSDFDEDEVDQEDLDTP